MGIEKTTFPQSYLEEIKAGTFKRMDAVENGGNGDGKITINEAYNSLNINSLSRAWGRLLWIRKIKITDR